MVRQGREPMQQSELGRQEMRGRDSKAHGLGPAWPAGERLLGYVDRALQNLRGRVTCSRIGYLGELQGPATWDTGWREKAAGQRYSLLLVVTATHGSVIN